MILYRNADSTILDEYFNMHRYTRQPLTACHTFNTNQTQHACIAVLAIEGYIPLLVSVATHTGITLLEHHTPYTYWF